MARKKSSVIELNLADNNIAAERIKEIKTLLHQNKEQVRLLRGICVTDEPRSFWGNIRESKYITYAHAITIQKKHFTKADFKNPTLQPFQSIFKKNKGYAAIEITLEQRFCSKMQKKWRFFQWIHEDKFVVFHSDTVTGSQMPIALQATPTYMRLNFKFPEQTQIELMPEFKCADCFPWRIVWGFIFWFRISRKIRDGFRTELSRALPDVSIGHHPPTPH